MGQMHNFWPISMRRVLALATSLSLAAGFAVIVRDAPAGADTVTFTSGEIGTSGSSPSFIQNSQWLMSWSYDCTTFGGPGNFSVEVNQPAGSSVLDIGPNELSTSGSGVDYYYDTGVFNLSIVSECDWTILVEPTGPGSLTPPANYTSTATGDSGNTQRFLISSNWTMSWTYDCSNFGSSGNFAVLINQPSGDSSFDVGPNELGPGGSGTDSYTDRGIFTLSIDSECHWTISINQTSTPAPTPAPSPIPPPAPAPPTAVGMAATPDGGGYWIAYSNGAVSPHGEAQQFGGLSGHDLNAPVNHIVATPDGLGYWLVAADGGIFTFGDAGFYGSTGSLHLNAPIVDMAPTFNGRGYYLVGGDGGIFTFGNAQFFGSTGSLRLNKPVVGMATTKSGFGSWLVATDGGIFAFGDAQFFGSTGALHLNKPVNGMAATVDNMGYWFVASDGGIFSFGDAQFQGSTGNIHLNAPIVGMAADYSTGGYWLLGADGGIFTENAPFFGAQ